ncbi:AAA family ATPase [Acidithiobacillus ferrooxidans]|uniref:AAA family ATPase n=1 Tax=Acidithiobacillus ferrooxidans TaxID=920 RepID=UPI0015DCAE1C|nr:AAA family ATPase [Acidithiobacillus ferrooxidans]MCR1341869.1 ATP-binding protein [Acidithiobacillus ferrooxidans]QLK42577.1 ATP-binding protein [Acidithiobacillus ferrooxidans]QZT51660.1 ATP-binding protein [Acidithiobacillus ferrooxidans]BDB15023.1 hypothetical protein ANFP_23430 [Acidithiobacillus ferrooxidans]
MSLSRFSYENGKNGLDFPSISLNRVNLFVGASAVGKTTLLNIMFDVARTAVTGLQTLEGRWEVEITIEKNIYKWSYQAELNSSGIYTIVSDKIARRDNDKENYSILYTRTSDEIVLDGISFPAFIASQAGIFLFKNHPELALLHNFFSGFVRRSFSGGELERAAGMTTVFKFNNSQHQMKKSTFLEITNIPSLNMKLFIIKRDYPLIYDDILLYYKSIFQSVVDLTITDAGRDVGKISGKNLANAISTPLIYVKEKDAKNQIPLSHLSSGMLKVLLILVDILTLNAGGVYFMDEYENSLGINAIKFLPDLMADAGFDKQFIITSHNPYVINKMPPKNWFLIKRKGAHVTIISGDELDNRYSASKQEKFIQLMADIELDI